MSSALPSACVTQSVIHGSQFSGTNRIYGQGNVNQVGTIQGDAYFGDQTTRNARKDFFVWLKQWIGNINFKKDHETILHKRYKDTGDWLLRRPEFQDWMGVGGESSSVLWCMGSPGIGKSVLASIVVDHLQKRYASDDHTVIAFAYFKHDSQEAQSPMAIIACFIRQLCVNLRNVPIPPRLIDFQHTSDETVEEPSIEEFAEELKSLGGIFEKVFVIVDALDECKNDNRKTILKPLFDFAKSHTCAKILVTSRDDREIRNFFTHQETPVIQIQVDHVSPDIRTYVEGYLEELLEKNEIRIVSPLLKAKVITRLTEKAQGMFLWVNLQLDQLCKHERDKDIHDELERLPDGLYQTYQRIVEQIRRLKPQLQKLAQQSLAWVFYSARPLSIKELIEATAVDDNCKTRSDLNDNIFPQDAIIHACSNLLVIEDDVVRPVHFSVREYFTQTKVIDGLNDITSIADPHFAHTEISLCCLRYLMLDVFWTHAETENDLVLRVENNSLAPYAAYFFDVHISKLDLLSSQLRDYIKDFLRYRNKSLKSVFQLRRFHGSIDSIQRRKVFLDMDYEVGPEDIIVASNLYNSKQLLEVDSKWKDLTVPLFALHRAVEDGALDTVQSLIKAGQPINELDYYGFSPLFYACDNGLIELTVMLHDYGAELDIICDNNETALYAASARGNFVIVRVLIYYGASINIRAGKHGNALCAAIYEGYDTVAQLLLKHEADPDSVSEDQKSAIFIASYRGLHNTVRMLLRQGARFSQREGRGRLPFPTVFLPCVKLELLDPEDALAAALVHGQATVARAFANHDLRNFSKVDFVEAINGASCAGYHDLVDVLSRVFYSYIGHRYDAKINGIVLGEAITIALANFQISIATRLLELGPRETSSVVQQYSIQGVSYLDQIRPEGEFFWRCAGVVRMLSDLKVRRHPLNIDVHEPIMSIKNDIDSKQPSTYTRLWYELTGLNFYNRSDEDMNDPDGYSWRSTCRVAKIAHDCGLHLLIESLELTPHSDEAKSLATLHSSLSFFYHRIWEISSCIFSRYFLDLLSIYENYSIVIQSSQGPFDVVNVVAIGYTQLENDINELLTILRLINIGPSWDTQHLTRVIEKLATCSIGILQRIGFDLSDRVQFHSLGQQLTGVTDFADTIRKLEIFEDCVYVLSFGVILYARSHVSQYTTHIPDNSDLLEINFRHIKLSQVRSICLDKFFGGPIWVFSEKRPSKPPSCS